jgi:carbamoyl-phosphate synthase/aspartate carbamoyltransferase
MVIECNLRASRSFPFISNSRIKGADPALRVEMASTGEVACLGQDLPEAFLKAILATGFRLPERKQVFVTIGTLRDKTRFLPSARLLAEHGFTLYATRHTSRSWGASRDEARSEGT